MITSPTLLLDEEKCRANIKRMAQKAENHGVAFKPHFKTHQSGDIGEWFREEGVTGITVSSIKMATYFAQHGWEDITIAFPVNVCKLEQINILARQIDLSLLISDENSLNSLHKGLKTPVNVFVEVDTGSHRTGIDMENMEEMDQLLETIQDQEYISCSGFYSHPGHSYAARSKNEILEIHADVVQQCTRLKTRYSSSGNQFLICIGDTPCCSVANDFTSIDEISPGNFVFYDIMQANIGSCKVDDIAVALACPVVAKYPARNEIIVHGGAIHLSKDTLNTNSISHFGIPVFIEDHGWSRPIKDGYVKSLSQEHGVIKCPASTLDSLDIGDTIGILPVHSCLTADLMMGYRTLGGGELNHIRLERN